MTTTMTLPYRGGYSSKGLAAQQHSQLASLKHYPQAIFLLSRDMTLLDTNDLGEEAIAHQWIGVIHGKLHFNNSENNAYVKCIAQRLCAPLGGVELSGPRSERFILRNLDMVCRPYTMTRESNDGDNLLLSIQADITCCDRKMECLSRAFSLTTSEARIVKMMVTGLKPKEIAYEAGISLNTVRSHLRTLYAKMHVNSYNDALTYAIKLLV